MANNNCNTPTPTPQAEQQPQQQQPLLAYDPGHEDVLVGEIPEIYFDLHRSITAILKDRNTQLEPQLRQQLVACNTLAAQLWFALMRLGKEAHQVQR